MLSVSISDTQYFQHLLFLGQWTLVCQMSDDLVGNVTCRWPVCVYMLAWWAMLPDVELSSHNGLPSCPHYKNTFVSHQFTIANKCACSNMRGTTSYVGFDGKGIFWYLALYRIVLHSLVSVCLLVWSILCTIIFYKIVSIYKIVIYFF